MENELLGCGEMLKRRRKEKIFLLTGEGHTMEGWSVMETYRYNKNVQVLLYGIFVVSVCYHLSIYQPP